MDTGALIVYMTAADADEAARIGRLLVQRRLAACVNVLGSVRSIYSWQGTVHDEGETAFIAKTWADRLDELILAVRQAHSYDVPCIVALPLAGGSAPFLDWIREQTRPDTTA
ncbi:divalent-cation tolerance protein CutA [Desulfocurvus vexinensis]|uniref:divalent-cation tolerance protein CutA n=1 Tax=Desulfocurvus vexinensis TaxID=399548 RepID=UPI00048BF750|nr:divalent-cation tolerance protein CutA [Desulfocurvus vexinensis]